MLTIYSDYLSSNLVQVCSFSVKCCSKRTKINITGALFCREIIINFINNILIEKVLISVTDSPNIRIAIYCIISKKYTFESNSSLFQMLHGHYKLTILEALKAKNYNSITVNLLN